MGFQLKKTFSCDINQAFVVQPGVHAFLDGKQALTGNQSSVEMCDGLLAQDSGKNTRFDVGEYL